MNRIFKSIWSAKTRTFVAVSELAAARGKATTGGQSAQPAAAHRWTLRPLYAVLMGAGLMTGSVVLAQQIQVGDEPPVTGSSIVFTGPGSIQFQNGGTLSGLSSGTLSSASSDAVTGAQLFQVNTNLSGRVDGLRTDLTSLGTDLTTLTGRVTTTEDDLGELSTRVTNTEGGLGSVTTRVTATEDNLGTLTTRVTGTENNVTTVTGRVDSLESRLYTAGDGVKYFRVNSTLADASATGDNALAAGPQAGAAGASAVAVGHAASAAGASSAALGDAAQAAGASATALGHQAQAEAADAVAIGSQARVAATAESGIALGQNAAAGTEDGLASDGVASIAIGRDSQAGGNRTVAVGDGAQVGSEFINDAIAIGTGARVSGADSHRAVALGANAQAGAAGATAVGANASATAGNAIALGNARASAGNALAAGHGAAAESPNGIALGTDAGAGTFGTAAADRTSHIAIGTRAGQNVVGNQTTAVGFEAGNNVTGDWNVAMGAQAGTGLTGDENTAVGFQANQGAGAVAHATAVGARTHAGADAVAVGYQANAASKGSVALGTGATVTTGQGVAIGDSSMASGGNIAIGEGSRATPADAAGAGYLTTVPFSGTVVSVGRAATVGGDSGVQRRIVNVAPGAQPTDAVNVRQLTLAQQEVANLVGGVTLNPNGTYGKIRIVDADNNTYDFDTVAEALNVLSSGNINILPTEAVRYNADGQINNVAAGTLNTDAVNVAQLNEVVERNGMRYVAINSDGLANESNSGAQGSNAIAIGAEALATHSAGLALGYEARSQANRATALGNETQALGTGSSAMGNRSIAYDTAGVAIGQEAISRGQNSLVMGTGAQADRKSPGASVDNAIVIGTAAEVTAEDGVAIGHSALASDVRGIAQGTGAHSRAADATAVGTSALATGVNATAGGTRALASGTSAQALGTEARAHATNAIALGNNAVSGKANPNPLEAADNIDTIAIGSSARADAREATALGRNALASGATALAIGDSTRVLGANANAVGGNHLVTGARANAFGNDSAVSATDANAVGNRNTVSAANGNVLGNDNTVSAANSGVLGNSNDLAAGNAFIVGNNASVANAGGVALGSNSQSTTGANRAGYVPNTGDSAGQARIAGTLSTTGAVAVGSDTVRRQITGLAAGTADSDAVNVAQLRATGWNVRTDGDTPSHVSTGEGHTVDIGLAPAENNLTVSRTTAGGQTVIDYALNKNLDLGTAGSVKTGNTTQNNAGVTVTNGGQTTQVRAGSVNVANGAGSVALNGTGQVIASNGTNTVTVNGATGTVNGLTNRTYTPGSIVNGQAATEDQLGQLDSQLTQRGFAVTAADGNTVRKPLGESIAIVEGDGNVTTRVVGGEVQLSLNDDVAIARDLTVGGAASVAGPLTVAGNSTLQGDVGITGNTVMQGTLGVAGDATMQGNLGVAGNTTMQGTLGVAGLSTLTGGAVIGNSLTVNPGTTIAMGGNRVTGVAAGQADTDAVNVSQLTTVATRPLTFTGNTGTVDRVLGQTLAIEGGLDDTALASGDNLRTRVVGATVQLEMAENLAATSLTIRNGGPRIDAQGIAMNNQQITGLAAGTAGDHAVNLSQLREVQDTAELGWNLGTNGQAANPVAPGATVDLSNTDGNIVVSQDGTDVAFDLADDVAIANDLTVGGAASVQGPLTVAGDTTLQGDLGVAGNTALQGSLDVAGNTTLQGDLGVAGDTTLQGSLDVTGNTALQGDLGVTGNTALQGNLGVTGDTTMQGNLGVTGNTTMQGALGVTGLSTLTGGAVIGNRLTVNPDTAISMGGNRVNDVAAGVDDTDAVNVSQLNTVANRPLTFTGNTGSVERMLGQTLAIEGGLAATADASGDNLRTRIVGETVQLEMAEDLTVASVSIRQGGPRIDAQGIAMGGTQITGLADGSEDDHAVNLSQLREVQETAELGWNLGTNGDPATQVKPGTDVILDNTDGNVVLTQDGTNVTFDLADDVAIANDLTVGGAAVVQGPLTVGGNTTLQGDLGVAGDTRLQGELAVDGDTDLQGDLAVAGNTALQGSLDVAGNTALQGNLAVNGNTTMQGNLGVTGMSTLSGGAVIGNSLTVNPNTAIRMGGNRITEVAAGVADTDAVNVSQLNTVATRPLTFTGNTGSVDRTLGQTLVIAGGLDTDADAGSDNLRTRVVDNTVLLEMAEDLNVTSVRIRNGGPRMDAAGIAMAGQQITGLAAGTQGDHAVNLSQLREVQDTAELGWNLGTNGGAATRVAPGASVDFSSGDGNIAIDQSGTAVRLRLADNIAINNNLTVGGDTVINGYTTLAGGVTVSNQFNVAAGTTIDMGGNRIQNVAAGVANTDAVNVGQLKEVQGGVDRLNDRAVVYDGNVGDPKDRVTLQGDTSTDGGRTGGTTITNLARGEVSATSTDAINGSQLHEVGTDVANGMGGNSRFVDGRLVTELNVGGNTYTNVNDALVGVDNKVDNVSNVANRGWDLQVNGDTASQVAPGSTVQFVEGENVTITRDGLNVTVDVARDLSVDSVKAKEVRAETVRAREVAIEDGPTLNQRGLDMANQRIQNVAEGVAPGDAVNLGQLDRVSEGMNQQVNRLDGRINLAEKRADAGTAAAMATAGLPQAYLPGKSMFAIGGGTWNGESGFAMGLSTVSDNGKWVVKGSGASSSRGDFGASVGVGYQW